MYLNEGERAAFLNMRQMEKMARSPHAFVRGNAIQHHEWLQDLHTHLPEPRNRDKVLDQRRLLSRCDAQEELCSKLGVGLNIAYEQAAPTFPALSAFGEAQALRCVGKACEHSTAHHRRSKKPL
jgi:hypothetical protein